MFNSRFFIPALCIVGIFTFPEMLLAENPLPDMGLRVKPAATLTNGSARYRIHLRGAKDADFCDSFPDAATATSELLLKWGVSDFIDVGFSAPIHMDYIGKKPDIAQGDTKVFTKFIYPPYPHASFFDLAFDGMFSLPTGSHSKGYFSRKFTNDKFAYSSGDIDFTVLVLGSFDFRKFGSGAPLSVRFNIGEEFTGQASQDDFYRAGVGITFFLNPNLEWLLEGSGETKAISGISPSRDPLRLSSGARFRFRNFEFLIGGDYSLTDRNVSLYQPNPEILRSRVQPAYSFDFSISYRHIRKKPSDPDGDKIFDEKDSCPDRPEDFDGFKDDDGCPDLDDDNDGIPDKEDKCPRISEDADGFQDLDGCPDLDNDEDGIPDSLDKCKNQPEDVDGFQDDDGCPDLDNDEDGIHDRMDKCPEQPEDPDGFEDHDGCPDLDNDLDGIPDSVDKCPVQKENKNGYKDHDGCPDKKPREIKEGRTVLGNVKFVQGSDLWVPESRKELDILVYSLKAYPDIQIEIHGHTDSFGSRPTNQTLSEKMAKNVRDYLIEKGIDSKRITEKGFGEEKPIAPNTTAKGRDMNRRIEIFRIK